MFSFLRSKNTESVPSICAPLNATSSTEVGLEGLACPVRPDSEENKSGLAEPDKDFVVLGSTESMVCVAQKKGTGFSNVRFVKPYKTSY